MVYGIFEMPYDVNPAKSGGGPTFAGITTDDRIKSTFGTAKNRDGNPHVFGGLEAYTTAWMGINAWSAMRSSPRDNRVTSIFNDIASAPKKAQELESIGILFHELAHAFWSGELRQPLGAPSAEEYRKGLSHPDNDSDLYASQLQNQVGREIWEAMLGGAIPARLRTRYRTGISETDFIPVPNEDGQPGQKAIPILGCARECREYWLELSRPYVTPRLLPFAAAASVLQAKWGGNPPAPPRLWWTPS